MGKNNTPLEAEGKKPAAKLTKSQLIKKQQRKRKLNKIISIGVCILLAAALIASVVAFSMSITPSLKSTVSVKSKYYNLDNSVVAYYLFSNYNTYCNQYSDYLTLMGLDTSKSLKAQEITDGVTWFDSFLNSTKNSLKQLIALASAAKDDGLEIDEDDKTTINNTLAEIEYYAKLYNYTLDNYIAAIFTEGVDQESVRQATELTLLAQKYSNNLIASYKYTTEDYDKYLSEHPEKLITADYIYYTFKAEIEEGADEEAVKAAMEKAKAEADDLAKATDVDSFKQKLYDILLAAHDESHEHDEDNTLEDEINTSVEKYVSSMSYSVEEDEGKWLFDSERKTNDVNVFEDTENNSYSVVMVVEPAHKDESNTLKVRHILFTADEYGSDEEAKAKAEEVLEEFKNGNATEESFAELAKKYSEDTGSKDNGGLIDQMIKGSTVDEFDEWCFNEERKNGDVEIVKT